MSVSQVCPGLFLCGLDSALNRSILSSRNITLIVNASGLEDVSYPAVDGLQILHVPVQDVPHAPLEQFFDPVAETISRNQTGATLVHCTAGRSRSPTLVLAYLMRCEGLSLRRAHELLLEQRPFIRPNSGFWRQLIGYEQLVHGCSSVRMASTAAGVLPEVLEEPDRTRVLPEVLGEMDQTRAAGATMYCVNI